MDDTGIEVPIYYSATLDQWKEMGKKDKTKNSTKNTAQSDVETDNEDDEDDEDDEDEFLSLIDLLDIELDSDQGWSGQLKYRRIPTTSNNVNDWAHSRYGQTNVVPNANRYNTDEIEYTPKNDIQITAENFGRGKVKHTLDFAKQVANEYSDYGVTCVPVSEYYNTTSEADDYKCVLVIPDQYKETDVWKDELQRRKDKYAAGYQQYLDQKRKEHQEKLEKKKTKKVEQSNIESN